ncbi:uncharacterized protein LOC102807431 [Saccoglossus kowalevskii]|uniref:Flocculation protein FLO11-like n=1 Tax=Saccoglossus kowalevskii TaxID=10224 RepID=A0ABM0M0S7_SACKO|nr:PREDICTED: flocculation protein FLO11-like [Saccoglossus kowalevskii]
MGKLKVDGFEMKFYIACIVVTILRSAVDGAPLEDKPELPNDIVQKFTYLFQVNEIPDPLASMIMETVEEYLFEYQEDDNAIDKLYQALFVLTTTPSPVPWTTTPKQGDRHSSDPDSSIIFDDSANNGDSYDVALSSNSTFDTGDENLTKLTSNSGNATGFEMLSTSTMTENNSQNGTSKQTTTNDPSNTVTPSASMSKRTEYTSKQAASNDTGSTFTATESVSDRTTPLYDTHSPDDNSTPATTNDTDSTATPNQSTGNRTEDASKQAVTITTPVSLSVTPSAPTRSKTVSASETPSFAGVSSSTTNKTVGSDNIYDDIK